MRLPTHSLDVLVKIFNHHNRGVDHCPDRHRESAQAHDVRAKAEHSHCKKCHKNTDRQSHNGHECALRMEEKENRYERDDDRLFDELAAKRAIAALMSPERS